jgi:hypothetical protein
MEPETVVLTPGPIGKIRERSCANKNQAIPHRKLTQIPALLQ